MTTNALVPVLPRFFNYQSASHYLLLPNFQQHTGEIVLPRTANDDQGVRDHRSGHPVPFHDREGLNKRTFPPHHYFFDCSPYSSDYGNHTASSNYTHVQDISDTYDRDGIVNTSPTNKGIYVDVYL